MSTLSKREVIARRVAREMKDGYTVNLGIGIPTHSANYIAPGIDVLLRRISPRRELSILFGIAAVLVVVVFTIWEALV